jgi:hypothetical protein
LLRWFVVGIAFVAVGCSASGPDPRIAQFQGKDNIATNQQQPSTVTEVFNLRQRCSDLVLAKFAIRQRGAETSSNFDVKTGHCYSLWTFTPRFFNAKRTEFVLYDAQTDVLLADAMKEGDYGEVLERMVGYKAAMDFIEKRMNLNDE